MKRLRNSIQLLVILVLMSGVFRVNAGNFPKSIQKKIDKAVKTIFPLEDLTMDTIDDFNFDNFKYRDIQNVRLRVLKGADKIMGFACFASSKGKNDFFDYMVLFDTELKIQKVIVLVYRSSYGGEIMAKSWLKQFIGKVGGEEMEFGKDIDGISGATISAPSISKGIKSISLLLTDLKANGEI